MNFNVTVENIKPVVQLDFELDLTSNGLTCIVGKNGVGKTTLIRAIRLSYRADTFTQTASITTLNAKSRISSSFGGDAVEFLFDETLGGLNSHDDKISGIGELCIVEMPMPHGDRFKFFQSLSEADSDIRRAIALEEHTRPQELIEFLEDVYEPGRFNSLIEISVRKNNYYCLLLEDGRYVREDYLSSGEYFLINLYRTIKKRIQLIVVDEIDISLDAAAQVFLIKRLRLFCEQYSCNVLFTTHSLAMMRTLHDGELRYMEQDSQTLQTTIQPRSFAYLKSLLFNFSGWDRYILTEDSVLHELLEWLISKKCAVSYQTHKIIHIGGGSQVTDLLRRNEIPGNHFLAQPDKVIAVLDGDQIDESFASWDNVHCIPIDSVEKELFRLWNESQSDFPFSFSRPNREFANAKDLHRSLINERITTHKDICEYIFNENETKFSSLIETLDELLSSDTFT